MCGAAVCAAGGQDGRGGSAAEVLPGAAPTHRGPATPHRRRDLQAHTWRTPQAGSQRLMNLWRDVADTQRQMSMRILPNSGNQAEIFVNNMRKHKSLTINRHADQYPNGANKKKILHVTSSAAYFNIFQNKLNLVCFVLVYGLQ